jgi:type II secretory pathway pseudopilin PulG
MPQPTEVKSLTVPVEPQMAWKQIISVVAVGMFSGFATSLVTTWYASKKQFYFWRWQQNISLCLEAYKAFRDLAEQYEKAMYQNPQQPLADDFRRKQLSVMGTSKSSLKAPHGQRSPLSTR